jgi:hypothetical protein
METQTKLTQEEFHLICDNENGLVRNFTTTNFATNFVWDIHHILVDSEIGQKWKVNENDLMKKLHSMSDEEILQLFIEVDAFWQRGDEHYQRFSSRALKSPANVLNNKP